MEPLIATLHIDWKIIIAQMVNFGLVFLVLYMFALKPLMALMLARTEAMLVSTKAEVDKMIEDGKKILEAEKVKMLMEAKKELVDLVVLATEKVTGTKDANLQEKALKEINSLTK